jgi:hypothetical protein
MCLTVVLDDRVIAVATIETPPAATPHLAIVRFHIDHGFFQHQTLTACAGHHWPPCGDYVVLESTVSRLLIGARCERGTSKGGEEANNRRDQTVSACLRFQIFAF